MAGGWINCWLVTDSDGAEYPDSFETIALAQEEINELMADIQAEIDNGLRGADEGYDFEEFRIYDKLENCYVG